MNFRRIVAIVRRDFWIMKKVKFIAIRVFYLPIISILVWGFFANWSKGVGIEVALVLLAVNIFWQLAQQIQAGANLQIMEDRWTESYKQIILTPIKPLEYFIGKSIYAIITSIASFIVIFLMGYFFFGLSVLSQQLPMFILLSFLTIVASIGVSALVESLILVLGNEYSFLAWSATSLVILLSAPFFPMTTFPSLIQIISAVMPYTWVFESVRNITTTGHLEMVLLGKTVLISFLYLLTTFIFYNKMFEKARKDGKLAKMW